MRFITAFNTLNDSIRPKPTSSCSAAAIFKFLARWQYHIYGDLNNSYFQLPVKKHLWSYLGVQTPFKGVRVMTRTGQGLLGSDVELGELLSRVLGEEISLGYCIAIRDDIIIGGNNIDEALSNYETVLSKLHLCNLKLSPGKTRIFPQDTEIYGYRIINGRILPSNHTVKSLGQAKIEELITNKHVNSWKGLYKTLIGHLPALSSVLAPFDAATAGKLSNEKFAWNPSLTSAFNQAMNHLDKINETYLPKPHEQLVLLPDAMSVEPSIGWVLYVIRNDKYLPVMFCSAKLKQYMTKWYPCEKEAVGVVVSLSQCDHWIAESMLPTLEGPDCLSVVKATELIRAGKHSSSPRLQSLLASVNRRNIRFFHNSAKAGLHKVPDHLSRRKDTTCNSKDCAIERFLDDIPLNIQAMSMCHINPMTTMLALCLEDSIPNPVTLAATSQELEEQLLKRSGPIPLGSRQTWMTIQRSDPDCNAVYHLKMNGELPRAKSTNPHRNKIFKEAILHKGLLIVRTFDQRKMREVDKVVIPPSYLHSIVTVLHLRLNHPKRTQLKQIMDRYFFSPRLDSALQQLYETCHLCIGVSKFPKELESFEPIAFPDHPGIMMNIDVLKRSGQLILVNIDLFSSFVTTCFVMSEKSEDLARAIIQATTPVRRSATLYIRTDRAPGFIGLASSQHSLLGEVGIKLELGDHENKNSNCSIDKAICELEAEFLKLSPHGEKVNSSDLAQATLALNNKIRKRGMTASEIHFSRDAHDHENLHLNDDELKQQCMNLRSQNHAHLIKNRAGKRTKTKTDQSFSKGDLVYMKNSSSKHESKAPHIVVGTDPSGKCTVRKTLHSSHFSQGSTTISPVTKTVATKFIYKSRTVSQPVYQHLPIDEEQSPVISQQPKSDKWNPIYADNEKDCETLILQTGPCLSNDVSLSDPETHDNAPPLVAPEEDIPVNFEGSFDHSPQYSSPCSSPEDSAPHESSDTSQKQSSTPSRSDSMDMSDVGNLPVIITYEEDDPVEAPENLMQDRIPKVNDHISFFNERLNRWVDAKITHDLSRRWNKYYNIVYRNGDRDGLFLKPNTRWTFLQSETGQPYPRGNLRDGSRPSSMHPSPASPEHRSQAEESEESVLSVVPSMSTLFSSSSENLSIGTLDRSRAASMEWDLSYLDLEASYSPQQQPTHHHINLGEVNRLDQLLPLSSTPAPPRRRLLQMRQSLPLEIERERLSLPAFLQKFNPFKKR